MESVAEPLLGSCAFGWAGRGHGDDSTCPDIAAAWTQEGRLLRQTRARGHCTLPAPAGGVRTQTHSSWSSCYHPDPPGEAPAAAPTDTRPSGPLVLPGPRLSPPTGHLARAAAGFPSPCPRGSPCRRTEGREPLPGSANKPSAQDAARPREASPARSGAGRRWRPCRRAPRDLSPTAGASLPARPRRRCRLRGPGSCRAPLR